MRLVDGKLLLEGYDEDFRVAKYETELTKRLIKLRNAEHMLRECQELLHRLLALEIVDKQGRHAFPMQEALISSACTYYFSCFQRGKLSAKLDPRSVFRDRHDMLVQHNRWRQVRDKRFNHPEEVGMSLEAGLVLDKDNKVLDVKVLRFDLSISQLPQTVEALRALVSHTLTYVKKATAKLSERIVAEAKGMSEEEISTLKPFTINRPNY